MSNRAYLIEQPPEPPMLMVMVVIVRMVVIVVLWMRVVMGEVVISVGVVLIRRMLI